MTESGAWIRPDDELAMTPRECMNPDEREYYDKKGSRHWMNVLNRPGVGALEADIAAEKREKLHWMSVAAKAQAQLEKAELVVMAARELWEADAAEGDDRDENRILTAWCNLILLIEHARGSLADPDVNQHRLADVIDQTRARDAQTDAEYAAMSPDGDLENREATS